MIRLRILLIAFGACLVFVSYGQLLNISGKIRDEKNEALPFASIQVLQKDIGAVSNAEGFYSIHVEPGSYTVRIQFLGYGTKDTVITLSGESLKLNIKLYPESLVLPQVTILSSNEDPAYAIMRRAIAKAPYHANQINSYTAKVYIKGSGRLLKVPFLFRNKIKKELAKEGIDSTVAFTQESVSKLKYIRPGHYIDTVISVRKTGNDNGSSPNQFVYSSFYDAKVANAVSPLSPNAFSIYKFEYLGFIEDHGTTINKIKVIPHVAGEQVFEGTLYITDNLWSIHSLDLTTSIWGIQFNIKQVFTPIQSDIWMPIDQIYDVGGNIFGFGFVYKYLAHLSDIKVVPNPNIHVPINLLDDKTDADKSKQVNAKIKPNSSIGDLNPNQELSAKQLRKMMKEYKKKELDSLPEVDTIKLNHETRTQVMDSMAFKRDSFYWQDIRPVALTTYETKGYARLDSLAVAQKDKKQQDSAKLIIQAGSDGASAAIIKNRSGFNLSHLITGGRYNINHKTNYITIHPLINKFGFNPVEGFHATYDLEVGNNYKKNKTSWKINGNAGYGISLNEFYYQADFNLDNHFSQHPEISYQWHVSTGSHPQSHSPYLSRYSFWNTYYAYLFHHNYLKLYDDRFATTDLTLKFSPSITVTGSLGYHDRLPLVNHTEQSLFKRGRKFESNTLRSNGGENQPNTVLLSTIHFTLTPFYRYVARDGYKVKDRSNSPEFDIEAKYGSYKENAHFTSLSFGIKHHLRIGAGDDWDYHIRGGIHSGTPYFQDFFHFPGNQFDFIPIDLVSKFRALPYYAYSTDNQYAYWLNNYQFRSFILTRIPYFRKKGIRENIVLNTLKTPEQSLYTEAGYGLNYILRVLRIEGVTVWEGSQYKNFVVRIGIATGFDKLFGND